MASSESGFIQAPARCVHEAIIAHNSASAVPQSMGFNCVLILISRMSGCIVIVFVFNRLCCL